MKKYFLVGILLASASACTIHPSVKPLRPENLINSSAERISFPIKDLTSVAAVEKWIKSGEKPSQAEIFCSDGKSCKAVRNLLKKHKIPAVDSIVSDSPSNVSLIYDHITARSCEDNHFGCATSVNSVQMVTNREQFVKPSISDFQDAARAVMAIGKYTK